MIFQAIINVDVDMRNYTFHVGGTSTYFNTTCNSNTCTTTYIGFVQAQGSTVIGPDSFSDPFRLGFESPFGIPYNYVPYTWSETYSNNFR